MPITVGSLHRAMLVILTFTVKACSESRETGSVQAANSWFFEGRWSIYSSWLGNEVHSNEVPGKQAEWFAKRRINWHVSSVVVRQEESLEVTWYVHLLNSCKQDWLSVLSVLENLFVTIKLQNSGIIKAFIRSDEAGCYRNSKMVSSLRARISPGNRTREVRSDS